MQPTIAHHDPANLESRQPGGARTRVLVVDDDEETRSLVEKVLARAGCEVLEAAGGDEAVRLLSRMSRQGVPIDLMITDLKMAGGSGYVALEAVQQHHPAMPVILMTAYIGPEVYREAMRLDASAVLQKPLDLQQLVLAVQVRVREDDPSGM